MAIDTTAQQHRILPGIVLMLLFCLFAPLIDVFAKLAAQTLPVGVITAVRFILQAAFMLPVLLLLGQPLGLPRALLPLVALRAVLLLLSTFSFVSALVVMPLADALAIIFVEPFILLLAGHLLFGDQVGPRRIAASVVGFAGALLVIQPSIAAFGLVALWPLVTAVAFAFYMLVTRGLAPHMAPEPMQFHTAWIGALMCLPAFALGAWVPDFALARPEGLAWLWLLGVGAAAALSHLFITYALRFAPSATLAPLHYLEIVGAVAFGYLIFGDFPNLMTWAGMAVITASGLYVIHRERVTARTATVTLPPTGLNAGHDPAP
jgi:drug/metabolite transporter (DMT)-like permease